MNETMLLAADAHAPVTGGGDVLRPDAMRVTRAETDVKTCPVCRARLFVDMDTCFNCMYRFGSNLALEAKAAERAHAQVGHDLQRSKESAPPKEEAEMPSASVETQLQGERDQMVPDQPVGTPLTASGKPDERLLRELLVELHGFLGQFLLDRGIDAKQL